MVISHDFGRVRRRLENAELAAPQSVVGRPRAKFQRLIARYDHRQRQLHALRGELAYQGGWVDLTANRRVTGDNRSRRCLKRQSAQRDGLRRGGAVFAAQRIARRERSGGTAGSSPGVVGGQPDAAASQLTDGTSNTNAPYGAQFPYVGTPAGGYQTVEAVPHT